MIFLPCGLHSASSSCIACLSSDWQTKRVSDAKSASSSGIVPTNFLVFTKIRSLRGFDRISRDSQQILLVCRSQGRLYATQIVLRRVCHVIIVGLL